MSTITKVFRVEGVLTNMTSVKLSSDDATFGVKRNDNDAVVVADNTAMTNSSTGVYTYTFTDPAYDLTYTYSLEFVYGGETYHVEGEMDGPVTPTGDTTDLYTLRPRMFSDVPGSTVGMQKEALRMAARDFCRDTEIWREQLTFDSVEDEDEYALNDEHSYSAEVYRVLTVTLDDNTVAEDDRTFDVEGTLTFDSAPDAAAYDIVVNTVLLPYISCAVYPAWLLRRWGEAICQRAVYLLKTQSKKPWTDPEGAELAAQRYHYAVAQAKGMVITAREDGDVKVQSRDFM